MKKNGMLLSLAQEKKKKKQVGSFKQQKNKTWTNQVFELVNNGDFPHISPIFPLYFPYIPRFPSLQ